MADSIFGKVDLVFGGGGIKLYKSSINRSRGGVENPISEYSLDIVYIHVNLRSGNDFVANEI